MKKSKKTVIGDVYNDLTVIEEPFKKLQGKTSRFFAKVRCKCGGEIIANCSRLRDGSTKKCPNCSWRRREEFRDQVPQIYQVFKRLVLDRCKKNNIQIDISIHDYEELSKQNCYYCNCPPLRVEHFKTRKYVNNSELFLNGIDRLDSKIGYTKSNCVPCCRSCNYAKHTLTLEEFKNKIIMIYNNLIRKESAY